MFLRYYGLNEQPFGMTPDYRFLYLSNSHREALASLIYGIEAGRGFMTLIAEPGMGKTTVLFQLLERLRNSARTVFLFQTQGNTREFLSNLIADLGLDPADGDIGSLQRQLNEVLIQEAQMGRQFVLVIDEAQNLDDAVLESVRMLSNFETSRSKLMQIVLAGQPPLAEKLARPDLEQLRQRVSVICRLDPLTEKEVVDYIDHRLRAAGYKGGQLFAPEALAMIVNRSEGIPRNINNLCFHALSLGYAKGQKRIDRAIIEEVLSDLKLDTLKKGRANPLLQQAKIRRPASGLESVTLNSGARSEGGRVLFRGARYSPSGIRRVAGGRRPRHENPRWLFWAVTLLTLVLAGELFWAYLPAGFPHHAISQFVDATAGHAKEVAAKYNLLKLNDSPASPKPRTTIIHSSANANAMARRQDVGSLDPADLENNAPRKLQSIDSSVQKATDSAEDVNDSKGELLPNSTPDTTGSKVPDVSPTDHFRPLPQVPKGQIVIESNIAGSAITINGQTHAEWQTPHTFFLPQGIYRVAISRAGYSTWFRDVRVTAGNRRWITADLRPPRGVIVIDTEPPGMQVFIDGKPYGPSEVEAALSVGSHTYKVVPPGGRQPLEGSFVLKPGDILTRKIRWLPPAGQPNADNGPDSRELRDGSKSSKGREES